MRDANGPFRHARPHGLPHQCADGHLHAKQRMEGEAVPVEGDGRGGRHVVAIAMEARDKKHKADHAQHVFAALRQSVADEFEQLVAFEHRRFPPAFPLRMQPRPPVDGHQRNRRRRAGHDRADGRAVEPQRRTAQMAEDQHPVGHDIHEQRHRVRQHQHFRLADSREESAEDETHQRIDAAERHVPEITALQRLLQFRMAAEHGTCVHQAIDQQDQRIADDGAPQRLPHHPHAIVFLPRPVVLRRQRGVVSHDADEKRDDHPAGDASCHRRRLVDDADVRQEQPVDEHHQHVEHGGEKHRDGDRQQLQNAARPVEMPFAYG